jgi:hypothetical protein
MKHTISQLPPTMPLPLINVARALSLVMGPHSSSARGDAVSCAVSCAVSDAASDAVSDVASGAVSDVASGAPARRTQCEASSVPCISDGSVRVGPHSPSQQRVSQGQPVRARVLPDIRRRIYAVVTGTLSLYGICDRQSTVRTCSAHSA